MSAPDPVRALARAVRALDSSTRVSGLLATLATGAAELADAEHAVVLRRFDGTWTVQGRAGRPPAADRLAQAWGDALDEVQASGRPRSPAGEPSGVLLPVVGAGQPVAVLAVLPASASPDPDSSGGLLLEVLCRHAGAHLARLDDADVRADLLGQRAAALSAMARLADTDSLTGAANRAGVFRVLTSLTRRQEDIGVVLLDLDDFKAVNDTYGHAAGDEVLRQVVSRVTRVIRPTDSLGRIGGDEFLVITRHADQGALAGLIRRIEQAMVPPVDVDGTAVSVSVSCGAALSEGRRSAAETMHEADLAMYDRKRSRVRAPRGRDVVDLHAVQDVPVTEARP